jgi:hypothetical protein
VSTAQLFGKQTAASSRSAARRLAFPSAVAIGGDLVQTAPSSRSAVSSGRPTVAELEFDQEHAGELRSARIRAVPDVDVLVAVLA